MPEYFVDKSPLKSFIASAAEGVNNYNVLKGAKGALSEIMSGVSEQVANNSRSVLNEYNDNIFSRSSVDKVRSHLTRFQNTYDHSNQEDADLIQTTMRAISPEGLEQRRADIESARLDQGYEAVRNVFNTATTFDDLSKGLSDVSLDYGIEKNVAVDLYGQLAGKRAGEQMRLSLDAKDGITALANILHQPKSIERLKKEANIISNLKQLRDKKGISVKDMADIDDAIYAFEVENGK